MPVRAPLARLLTGACLLVAASQYSLEAASIYYVNQPEGGLGRINVVKPDGTGHSTVHTTASVSDLRGIAVDPLSAKLYYAHTTSNPTTLARTEVSIRSIPTSGGSPSIITTLPDGTFVADVEWDEVNGWIYFAQTGDRQLRRIKPDGSQLSTIVTTLAAGSGPYFIGIDVRANFAYWGIGTDSGDTFTPYARASLATGVIDPTFSLVTPTRTRDIAVDNRGSEPRLYWCDRQNGAVYNRLASGGVVLTSRTGLNAPHGLVLDLEAGKGYVADTGKRGNGSQASSHRVVRFNLDGSGVLEFLSPFDVVAEPWDLAGDFTSTSYADWKTRFFAANASGALPEDDPDADGIPNIAEYAFFTHPQNGDANLAAVQADGRAFVYARRRMTDVAYRVEISNDLQTWHWNGDTPGAVWTTEVETLPRDADSLWVKVLPAGGLENEEKIFYRLRAIGSATLAPASRTPVVRTESLRKFRTLRTLKRVAPRRAADFR